MLARFLVASIFGALFCVIFFCVAQAQTPTCRTAPVGTSTNICASEAFVTSSAAKSSPFGNIQASKTGTYSAVNADCNSTIPLGGAAFYTFTLTAPANYTAPCAFLIVNEDTGAGKSMVISGMTTFLLFPGISVMIFQTSGVWRRFP